MSHSKGTQTHFKPHTAQTVAYTGTAGTSSAIGTYTNVVRLVATTACFVTFGSTATTAGMFLPANTPELFSVNGGVTISAIQSASGGNLHITEMTQ
jgi:hypothetical protein